MAAAPVLGTGDFGREGSTPSPRTNIQENIMECPFKVGDLVQLKAGGPKMVVYLVNEYVTASWFDRNDHLCRDSFTAATLLKVE